MSKIKKKLKLNGKEILKYLLLGNIQNIHTKHKKKLENFMPAIKTS